MLRGFLAGYIFNYIFNKLKIKSVIISIAVTHLLISVVFIPGLLNYHYNVPFINNMQIRLIIQLVAIPLFSLVFYYILKGMKKSKELKNLHTRLKELLKVDELTGLSNRRDFMDYLNEMVSLSKRRSQSLSLLMADIDNFKNINDTYGHHMGDEFLKAVGDVLKDNTREEDLAARMGGDEFVILLPQTSLKEALNIAERIKESVKGISILSENNINTLSIGAAVLNNDDNSESLLKKADDALYKAKEKGRNRVESLQYKNAEQRQELKFT
jgi:diguanylate cyclase (GGDEF)-like protein